MKVKIFLDEWYPIYDIVDYKSIYHYELNVSIWFYFKLRFSYWLFSKTQYQLSKHIGKEID